MTRAQVGDSAPVVAEFARCTGARLTIGLTFTRCHAGLKHPRAKAHAIIAGGAMTMESCCADRNRYILPVLWFMAGFSRAVPSVAMRILMVNELKVQPAQQAMLGVAGGLPWSFKIFAAFLSDAVPVFGRRRVPYIVLSLLLQLTAYYILASDMPSVAALGALDFMQACGMVFIGTMADTLIVESMRRLDSGRTRFGALQANCWISMFIGGLLGNAISGHLHAATSTQAVFALTATLKVGMLLIPVTLDDLAGQKLACADRARFRQLRIEIVEGASDPRVWRPVLFLFIFSACPQNGDAWNSFLFGTPSAPPVVSNASRSTRRVPTRRVPTCRLTTPSAPAHRMPATCRVVLMATCHCSRWGCRRRCLAT